MSLQIRRGTDSQRLGIVFDDGEISWTSDTKKLYIGDGSTTGGINVLANAAGTGLIWDGTTQTLNFSGSGLGLTTSVVAEGTNLYYTDTRAKNAAASIFTASGSPTVTGNVTATVSGTPSRATLNNTAGLVAGEQITVTGTGGNGLTAGVYYIYSIVDSANITLSSSRANYLAGTTINNLTTGALSTTSFSAGGGSSQLSFTYNPTTQMMDADVTLVGLVSSDPSPTLGANLTLAGRNIIGTGNIGITGDVTASNSLTATSGAITAAAGNIVATLGNITAAVGGVYTNNMFAVSPSTQIYIGSNTTTANVQVISDTSVSSIAGLTVKGLTDGTAGIGQVSSTLRFKGQRGTLATPIVLGTGDGIGQIYFTGYVNGGSFGALPVDLAVIKATISNGGDLVSTVAKTKIEFIINTDNTPANIISASFNSNGAFTAPVIQLATYANDAARTAAVPTPAAGMMVFMTSGTSPAVTNKAVIYNGSAWALLPG